ncbi:MAG: outer membrane lipoprotein carrier protein LolA [Sedimentisphaerales bacterium]|nr:outer membrane lipoprotein carrier protein LolA [Sedimentisphaerales bacterium]
MKNENIKDILKNLGNENVPEDIQKIAKETSDNFSKELAHSKHHEQHYILEFLMKSKITKIATAAAIIIAALVVFNQFDDSNVVFADMIKNIQNAKTLVFDATFLLYEGSSVSRAIVSRAIILGPNLLRYELSDGQVWIMDQESEETLILNPNNNTAIIGSTHQGALDLYDSYANFKDLPGSTVKEVRNDEINSKLAVAFHLEITIGNNENFTRNVIVWVDPETQLPILMKETLTDTNGTIMEIVMDNIIFDEDLDASLFSFDIPSGYQVIDNRGIVDRLKSRIESATEMNIILKSCRMYESQHGTWPNSLQDLGLSGIDDSGYIYLKPLGQIDDSTIVLYQVYSTWAEGINVGFGNFQVKFIQDEVEFKRMLKQE